MNKTKEVTKKQDSWMIYSLDFTSETLNSLTIPELFRLRDLLKQLYKLGVDTERLRRECNRLIGEKSPAVMM